MKRVPISLRSRRRGPSLVGALALSSLFVAAVARADGVGVPLDKIESGAIKLNGVLTEWPQALTPLKERVSGKPGSGADLTVRAGLSYDDAFLYVGADIQDDKLVRTAAYGDGEDHLTLTLVFPGEGGQSSVVELGLFQGDPGNVAGAVRAHGTNVNGASLVEAPRTAKDGFTFEAKIPWAAFPAASRVRCGLRGALRYVDNDGGGPKGTVGTSAETSPNRLPFFPIDAEQSIADTFAKEHGVSGAPQGDLVADLTGDEMRERILVWDHYVLVLGPHFREGKEFFFSDLGVEKSQIQMVDAKDLTGDGKAEILVQKRKGSGASWIETLEASSFSEQGMTPVFRAVTGISTDQGSVTSVVRFSPGAKEIEIALGASNGLSASNFRDTPESGWESLLLPWGAVRSRTWQWDGSKFSRTKEDAKPAGDSGASTARKPAAPPEPPAPPPARPPTADELSEQVLALYKRDRKIGAAQKPRFDLATNVAEDTQNERILVFGKELVVFGKGFQKGLSYVSIGLGFADARDVFDVTTRDLNGDGRAEIIVRGVVRMNAPKELGGGKAERELVLVYTVGEGKLGRVFGAETGLVLADKRVTSTLSFVPADKGMDLVLGPGHAVGWDAKTFPYKQDTAPVGSVEPMVLPWTDAGVRYRWSGSGYAR